MRHARYPGTVSFRMMILFAVCQTPFFTCKNYAKSSLDNFLRSISSSTVTIEECLYDCPTPCRRQFQNRFRAIFSLIFFFVAGPTCSCGCYCKRKSIMILFFNMAACSGKYSLFSVSCNLRFGGGYRINKTLEKHHWDTVQWFWYSVQRGKV